MEHSISRNYLNIFYWRVEFYTPCKWNPCHHGMACLQVADGGDALQMWRVAPNILNK
jgi:hypothetical protein